MAEIQTPSVTTDPKLQYAMPMENELRVIYPFANLYFSFPTKPYTNNNIFFPAYLKKIDDSFTPEYTSTKVFGRSDPIPTYKGTTRKISTQFDIPAYSEYDANEIMKKFNLLIKNLYPGYIENQGQKIINSPPLIRLKFANIINNPYRGDIGLLGYPDAVTVSNAFETAGTFIIADSDNKQGYIYAKAYTLSFNFTVLHEEVIGWDDSDPKKFIGDQYPYKVIGEDQTPTLQKGGSAYSNLRGNIVQTPATAKGLTMVLGGFSV